MSSVSPGKLVFWTLYGVVGLAVFAAVTFGGIALAVAGITSAVWLAAQVVGWENLHTLGLALAFAMMFWIGVTVARDR